VPVQVPATRDELALMTADVGQRAEAVVFQPPDPLWIIEWLGDPNERHRLEAGDLHDSSLPYARV